MNNKLLLQDLVDQLAEEGNLKKKDAEEFLRAFFKVSEEALFEGEIVKVPKLGSFKLIMVDARKSVNVATGEEIEIKEHYKLSFTPDSELKELVNKPYAHLDPVELDTAIQANPKIVEKTIEEPKHKAPKKETNPIINDLPLQPDFAPAQKKPKNSLWIWVIFFVTILLLSIWSYISNEAQKREDSIEIKDMEIMDSLKAATSIPDSIQPISDSIQTKKDSLKVHVELPKTPPTQEQEIQTTTNGILAVVELKKGQRLTWLSEKYYGHKAFWVYIYEANKDIIKNPNVIPEGATIQIPKPDPRIINANNPTLVAKAKALQAQILEN